MQKKFSINMTLDMVQALNDLLMGLNPKGRTERRKHKAISLAMRAGCTIEKFSIDKETGAEGVQRFIKRGDLELETLEIAEYLADQLEAKTISGIQGQFSIGYDDLAEALNAFPELKDEEEKK